MTIKRYMLFAYDAYYPSGSINDLKLSSDDLHEVLKWANDNTIDIGMSYDYYDILDTKESLCFHIDRNTYDVEKKIEISDIENKENWKPLKGD